MSDTNQNNSSEKCRKELINYKFDEILDFYAEDFGDAVRDDIENKIISEIGEENPEYYYLFEQRIIRLWYELVYKVADRLDNGLTKLPNTIDFSDITIELENIRKKAKDNRNHFETLKEIYFDDINRVKIRVKSRLDTTRNIQKENNKQKSKDNLINIAINVVIGLTMLGVGYIISRLFK